MTSRGYSEAVVNGLHSRTITTLEAITDGNLDRHQLQSVRADARALAQHADERIKKMETDPTPVTSREELVALARHLGVRADWHEPDEQNISAYVTGTRGRLDNAMGTATFGDYGSEDERRELCVVLVETAVVDGQRETVREIAIINLANLLAWASQSAPEPDYSAAQVSAALTGAAESLERTTRRLRGLSEELSP